MNRCIPRLHRNMKASIAQNGRDTAGSPRTPRPAVPMAMQMQISVLNRVSRTKNSRLMMKKVKNPGSSRGNSSAPRDTARTWNRSTR